MDELLRLAKAFDPKHPTAPVVTASLYAQEPGFCLWGVIKNVLPSAGNTWENSSYIQSCTSCSNFCGSPGMSNIMFGLNFSAVSKTWT
jgi:hypothetical protein